MNKDLDKVIRYVYNEFGQEFGDIIVDLKHQLQSYKDKYSDLETDYAKSVENEKTLRYTVNKYYDENKAYKDKEDKLIKWCYEHGQAIDATDILDIIDPKILNEGGKE